MHTYKFILTRWHKHTHLHWHICTHTHTHAYAYLDAHALSLTLIYSNLEFYSAFAILNPIFFFSGIIKYNEIILLEQTHCHLESQKSKSSDAWHWKKGIMQVIHFGTTIIIYLYEILHYISLNQIFRCIIPLVIKETI